MLFKKNKPVKKEPVVTASNYNLELAEQLLGKIPQLEPDNCFDDSFDEYCKSILTSVQHSLLQNSSVATFDYGKRNPCLYNKDLFDILMIRKEHSYVNHTTWDILYSLVNAKEYLDTAKIVSNTPSNVQSDFNNKVPYDAALDRPLSARQISSVESIIALIMKREFYYALQEFIDCVSDYGRGDLKVISVNEYALYQSILVCFLNALKHHIEKTEYLELAEHIQA